ncbi:CU044_5270 family protein [Cellulomonas hominis]|uniref:CU044_5270 family protein n=1 Tax=Cellulomonas hominis TaxID=156981 RepID=UPI001C1262C2|nr:CU044_5270 family protein [Cellulomonas hominis]MBU5422554.1 CU044_5270 family protein [Cellulomonas hominis]
MNLDSLVKVAGDVGDVTPRDLEAGRRALGRAMQAADARVLAARRRRQRRRGLGALVGAAAAAAAVVVAPLLAAGPASAEEVLLATAAAAGEQPDETADAAYWHVVSEVDYPDTEPFRREIWQARTGVSVLRDASVAAEAARAAGTTALDPALIRTQGLDDSATFVVGGDVLTWSDLESLPTDAGELETVLRAKVGDHPSGDDNELWESVTGLLRESPASPELRRALWQVAAGIPGVELLGSATDSAGREGTALERDELDQGWYRMVYILDATDGTLLETRNIDADGAVVYRSTALTQGPSATAPAEQDPVCGPGADRARSC